VKTIQVLCLGLFLFSLFGCETVHDAAQKGGSYMGKAADSVGGVTEGAADAYRGGKETSQENPYGR